MPYPSLKSITAVAQSVTDVLVQVPSTFPHTEGLEVGSYRAISCVESQSLLAKVLPFPHTYSPGGAVANTLDALASFKHLTTLITGLGDDSVGASYHAACRKRLTSVLNITTDPKVSAVSVSLVIPSGERTMRTYLGASTTLDGTRLLQLALTPSSLILIEGYLVANGLGSDTHKTLISFIRRARSLNCRIVFALPPVSVISTWHPVTYSIASEADLISGNLDEFQSLLGTNHSHEFLSWGLRAGKDLLVTAGSHGATALVQGVEGKAPAPICNVVDLTGAGDSYLAGFLHGLLSGATVEAALLSGASCAAQVISQFGARLP